MELVINLLFSVIILIGVVMTLIGLPGNLLIVMIGFAYGYYENFQHINYSILVTIIVVFIVSECIDFMAGILGAKKEKASKRSMVAAFVGTILGGIGGTLLLPIIGSIVGALVGAFTITALAEYTKEKNKERAKRVAISVLKGQIWGMILKFTTAVAMSIILLYQMQW